VCGIAGLFNSSGPVDEELLARMCSALEHRGPDSHRRHVEPGLGLGVQRLAIIDVRGGDQPVFNEHRDVAVVMNGEIYNYLELRDELERRGHRFRSRVDTEVLVHLYEEVGDALVDRLRGMFAFAIWDRRRRRLLLARDRFGKKPLFWTRHRGGFAFASELRALLQDADIPRALDPRAIDAYLTFRYVPHPLAAVRGVQKLPPASTLAVDESGETIRRYWRLDFTRKLTGVAFTELADQLREHIREATRIRMMSEVPLGAFLSGGTDSSVVVAAMAEQSSRPVRTFSIGFDDTDFDETRYARLVARRFGTQHQEFRVEPQAVAIMPAIARHYGEPFADSSAIPSFYLAQLTSRHVTVALNGDGGDEAFAGYGRYLRAQRMGHLDWLPRLLQRRVPLLTDRLGHSVRERSLRNRARRLGQALAMEPWERYTMSLTVFDREGRERLRSAEFTAELDGYESECLIADAWDRSRGGSVDRMLEVDIETYLPGDLLPKMDIATMAYSVEARSPFLDHRLMEFAASLPEDAKLHGGTSKRLLKLALRGWVPDEVLDRPKMGFGVPLARWFRGELRDLPGERLLDRGALDRGYLRRDEIERLIAEHHRGDVDHSVRLWTLLQLDSWHREVLEAPVPAGQRAIAVPGPRRPSNF
jgi:asparagine synthase (glutamine-hydrolysing)